MTQWNPWFTDRDDDDLSLHPLPWRWDEALAAQQRFWTECMEASQIWLSWWVSSLPPVNWPPAGVVLPPAPVREPGNGHDAEHAAANAAAVARKAHAAPVARHH